MANNQTLGYLLLRLEDNALLVGAVVASFLAVAAVMFFTRNMNWYSAIQSGGAQAAPVIQKNEA